MKPRVYADTSVLGGCEDDEFRVFLRFFMKKVISVVVNSEHDAQFFRPARDRAHSRIYSMRIAEVENTDTPREREYLRHGGILPYVLRRLLAG